VTRTRFDPFGTPLTALPDVLPGTAEPGFGTEAGKLTDTLTPYGLIEMGSRLYSSVLGRFLQVDPVPGGGVNAYAYPPDPINANDYSGNTVAILGGPFFAELGAGVGAIAVAADVAVVALAVGIVAGLFYLSSSNRETRVSIPRVDLARFRKAANVTIPRPGLAPKLDRNGKIYKVYEILTDSHWTVWKYGITSKLGSGGGSTRPQSQLPRCQRDTGAKCTWNWDSDAEYNYSGARAREFELISEYRSLRGYCPLGQMFSCK
jgi:RHS repeat-associated protein